MIPHLELFQILLSINVIFHHQMLGKLIVLIQLNALEKMERMHAVPISHQRHQIQQYIIQQKYVFYRRQVEMIEELVIFINVHKHVLKIQNVQTLMMVQSNVVGKQILNLVKMKIYVLKKASIKHKLEIYLTKLIMNANLLLIIMGPNVLIQANALAKKVLKHAVVL